MPDDFQFSISVATKSIGELEASTQQVKLIQEGLIEALEQANAAWQCNTASTQLKEISSHVVLLDSTIVRTMANELSVVAAHYSGTENKNKEVTANVMQAFL